MTRAEKAQVIDGIRLKADAASFALIADFRGRSVEEIDELRFKLREAGVEYKVVKNTLCRIAFQETPHKVLNDSLKEQCAIIFGLDDPVSAAKAVVDYAKGDDKFVVKAASLEGTLLDENGLKDLSKMPNKDELRAKMLSTMLAVPTKFVQTMGAINDAPQNLVNLLANVQRDFLNVLSAYKAQKEEQ